MTLIRSAIRAVLTAVLAYTWVDPDLWGHVRFGQDIVQAGSIPRIDPYAFTSDRSWVNHEWLAEVAMYASYALGGSAGLILLKLGLAVAAMAVIAVALRREPSSPAVRDGLLGLAVVGSLTRLGPVRPQVFSLLLFAVLLAVLVRVDRGHRRWLFALPPIMTLWVNTHGGWLVGLGAIGVWSMVRAFYPSTALGRRRVLLLLGASVVATLANPYGFGMWEFLASTVRLGRADIEDWQPITAFPLLMMPWGVAWLVTGAAVYHARAALPGAYLTIVVGLGLASLSVSRLDAFFVFSVVTLLGPSLGRREGGEPVGRAHEPENPRSVVLGVSAVAWLAIVAAAAATWWNVTCLRLNDDDLPDAQAATFITRHALAGRMVTWFNWGEYAIWHFAPSVKVSMDGRRETVYSNARIQDHLSFYFNRPGARTLPRLLRADYIWLPRQLPVVEPLIADGWHPIFDGPRSVVLAAAPHPLLPTLPQRPTSPTGLRCFPGP